MLVYMFARMYVCTYIGTYVLCTHVCMCVLMQERQLGGRCLSTYRRV